MGTRAARIGAGIGLALGIVILCPPVLWAMGAAEADIADGNLTWALLAGGLLGAALGTGWIVSAARCRGKIERLVSARTRELSEMNERLRRQAAEHESAQSSLSAHHSLLQAVIDASPTLIFIKDRDGIWILANQTLADIYGLTPQQMVGITHQEMGQHLGLPEAELEHFLETDQRVIDSGESMVIPEAALHHHQWPDAVAADDQGADPRRGPGPMRPRGLRRRHRAEGGRDGAAARQAGRRGRESGQERIPRKHEP
jgi:PAS domain-containing protein